MKCPTCGNDGVIHGDGHCKDYPRCVWCGRADSPDAYRSSEVVPLMRELSICFHCAWMEEKARAGADLVIDGCIYGLGPRKTPGPYNGMGGRWFDIEYFDGRRIRTCDLWAGSKIPERFRDRLPDTARFLNGAGFVKVGDGGCWNASSNQKETH